MSQSLPFHSQLLPLFSEHVCYFCSYFPPDKLTSAFVPQELKSAVVKTIHKKPGLDAVELSNYRPITNLPLIAKLLERVVASQLQSHVSSNNLDDPFHSGFHTFHNSETALLIVLSSFKDAKTLVHAFITSHLDYCNALFIGPTLKAITRLQYILYKCCNSAARVLTHSFISTHITPILLNLHWLPVVSWIKYKMIMIIIKCLY